MIRVLEIRRTCHACPAQWEGMVEDGQHLYIRYRWGWLRVEVGNEIVYHQRVGGEFDGDMEGDELQELLKDVLDFTGVTDAL